MTEPKDAKEEAKQDAWEDTHTGECRRCYGLTLLVDSCPGRIDEPPWKLWYCKRCDEEFEE